MLEFTIKSPFFYVETCSFEAHTPIDSTGDGKQNNPIAAIDYFLYELKEGMPRFSNNIGPIKIVVLDNYLKKNQFNKNYCCSIMDIYDYNTSINDNKKKIIKFVDFSLKNIKFCIIFNLYFSFIQTTSVNIQRPYFGNYKGLLDKQQKDIPKADFFEFLKANLNETLSKKITKS